MRALVAIVAGVTIFLSCAGSSPVSGAAGGGTVVGAEGLERCDAPLGLVAIADPRDDMIRAL